MKSFKRIFSMCVALCMMLAMVSIPAMAATYTINGDGVIIAAHDSAVMVGYTLLADGTATTANWSIESDDAKLKSYAAIDSATGSLYVSKDALGKLFTVVASVDGSVVAKKDVEVADKHYFEDFEGETIGSTVTSDVFSTKTATVVANGSGKAAKATTPKSGATVYSNYPLVITLPEGFASENYSVKADVMNETGINDKGTEDTSDDVVEIFSGRTFMLFSYKDAAAPVIYKVDSEKYADGKARYVIANGSTTNGAGYGAILFDAFMTVRAKHVYNGTTTSGTFFANTGSGEKGVIYPGDIWDKDIVTDKVTCTELQYVAFGSYVDNIEIYSGTKAVYEFPEVGPRIVGDKLILPSRTGAVKLAYTLQDDNGAAMTATWSLSGDSDVAKYAEIVAETGELYVSSKALGKKFTLTATSGAVTATREIKVSDKCYFEDFEDEGAVGSTVTSDLFSSKSAKIVANGTGKAAAATGSDNKDVSKYTLNVTLPDGFESLNYNVEAKLFYGAALSGDKYSMNTGAYFVSLLYADAVRLVKIGADGFSTTDGQTGTARFGLRYLTNTASFNSAANNVATYFNKFMPIRVNVVRKPTEIQTFVHAINTDSGVYNKLLGTGFNVPTTDASGAVVDLNSYKLSKIGFGSTLDDIEIYTGEKVEHAFETGLAIKGNDKIMRAPEGTTSINKYSIYATEEGVTVPSSVTWALVNAPNGVTIPDASKGEVYVAGNASTGTFTLKAVASDGETLAIKDIVLPSTLSKWSQPYLIKARYYDDFEETGKDVIRYVENEPLIGKFWVNEKETAIYSPLQYTVTESNPAYIRKEANGNKYVSSTGILDYSTGDYETGANGAIRTGFAFSAYTDGVNTSRDMASVYTIEAKMMAEGSLTPSATREWTLFGDGANGKNVDIRYRENANGTITINRYWKDDSGISRNENLAVKNVGEWFDFRFESDIEQKIYSVWIDNVKVVDNAYSENGVSGTAAMFGISIDNIALYTGSKAAETVKAGETFQVLADGVELPAGTRSYIWTKTDAEGEKSSAAVTIMSDATDYSGNALVVANYSADGKLIAVDYETVKKSQAGICAAVAEIEAPVTANDYFKVFLWNAITLQPLK